MKHKGIWIAGIILVVVIGIILWLYPKFVLVKAVINFSNIDSIHVEGTLTLKKDSYELDLKGNANYSNNVLNAKLSTDYLWNPLNAELYVDFSKNVKFYLTTNVSNEWISSTQKKSEDLAPSDISLKDISFKKVNSDRKGEKKYRITISEETFENMLSSYLKNASSTSDKVTIYIYVKDGNISGIKVKDKILISKEDNLYLSDIDLTFSSWNGISTITISEDIKENSKEIDKNVLETLFS